MLQKETHNEPNKSNGAKTVASGGLAVVDVLSGDRHPRRRPIGQRYLNRHGEGRNRRIHRGAALDLTETNTGSAYCNKSTAEGLFTFL